MFAKLEYLNPGGSVKDRAAIGIIKKAEEQGPLKPDRPLWKRRREYGVGLALIGVNKGYRVVVCVPEKFAEVKVKSCGRSARKSFDRRTKKACKAQSPEP